MNSRQLIDRLGLMPHPEGGWYRELFRSAERVVSERGPRSALTTIYYLLEQHQMSRWHVVDAEEVWHFYAGAPLELFAYAPDTRHLTRHLLASPAVDGEAVGVVPSGIWQAARSTGEYSLVGCTVAPGFEFDDFRFVSSVPNHADHFARRLNHLQGLL
jgi:uncharacterized protein